MKVKVEVEIFERDLIEKGIRGGPKNCGRKLTSFFLIYSGALSLLFSASSFMISDAATNEEWHLKQKISDLGDFEVYVTPGAIKLDNTTKGCTFISKAPDWDLYYFRKSEKKIWHGQPGDLTVKNLVSPYSRYMPDVAKSKAAGSTESGGSAAGQSKFVNQKLGTGVCLGQPYHSFESDRKYRSNIYWLSDNIATAPEACEVLGRLCGVPWADKILLYVTSKRRDASRTYNNEQAQGKGLFWAPKQSILPSDLRTGTQVVLTTSSCEKRPFNSHDFDIPKNFSKVPDLIDISFSSDVKSQVGDVFDNANVKVIEDKRDFKNKKN